MVHRLSKPASSAWRARPATTGPMRAVGIGQEKSVIRIPSCTRSRLAPPRRTAQALLVRGTGSTTPIGRRRGRLDGVQGSEIGPERDSVASYLRAWRARLQPADVGLPAAGPRRTRGLRR